MPDGEHCYASSPALKSAPAPLSIIVYSRPKKPSGGKAWKQRTPPRSHFNMFKKEYVLGQFLAVSHRTARSVIRRAIVSPGTMLVASER